MQKRFALIGIGLVLLLGFYLFSAQVKRGALKNMDFAATVKLQERIDKSSRLRLARAVGEVMEGATFFASPLFASLVVIALTAWGAGDWKRKRIRWGALVIPLAFALIVAGEVYGKTVVHHPSPPFFMIKNPTSIFPKDYINEQFSYPSGHAARAVFIGIVTWFLAIQQPTLPVGGFNNVTITKKKIGMGLVVGFYIGVVSISRIYLGHHWLSDILGGGMLGTALALLSAVAL